MASLVNSFLICFIAATVITNLHLHSSASQPTPPPTDVSSEVQEFLFEEKARLGSRPPSCHSKCNECSPCIAVQVPTVPSHDNRVRASGEKSNGVRAEHFDLQSTTTATASVGDGRYSDYKPLGWKCRCGNHLYNP